MSDDLIVCFRCHARKKIYKIGNGYSHADTGGLLVDCPMCLGVGKIKSLGQMISSIVIDEYVEEPAIESCLKLDTPKKSKKISKEHTSAEL